MILIQDKNNNIILEGNDYINFIKDDEKLIKIIKNVPKEIKTRFNYRNINTIIEKQKLFLKKALKETKKRKELIIYLKNLKKEVLKNEKR